jgi:hypothetical protein
MEESFVRVKTNKSSVGRVLRVSEWLRMCVSRISADRRARWPDVDAVVTSLMLL